MLLGRLLTISRIFFSPPNGIRKNSYCPSGVTNTVLYTSSTATCICQYPLVLINLGQVFLATGLMEQVLNYHYGFWVYFVIMFNFLKSTHTLLESSFFLTMTMGDAVGLISLISSILSTSFHSSSLLACGKG